MEEAEIEAELEGHLVEYLKNARARGANVDQVLEGMTANTDDPEIRGQLELVRISPIARAESHARRSQLGSTLLGRRQGH